MASDLNNKMKKAWLKSMEAIGNTASNIADNTRYKVNEMNLVNRRREILSDFGARAYALWQKGESFPDELAKQLEELSQVDAQLNAIRTERFAGIKTADEQAQKAADDAPQQTDVPTMDEVAQKGAYMREKIAAMPHVCAVRGQGMMIGILLDEGLQARAVAEQCLQNGLLILTAKTLLRLLPPLTISYEEIDRGLAILQKYWKEQTDP